jgi:HK97 family phage major capsid protein
MRAAQKFYDAATASLEAWERAVDALENARSDGSSPSAIRDRQAAVDRTKTEYTRDVAACERQEELAEARGGLAVAIHDGNENDLGERMAGESAAARAKREWDENPDAPMSRIGVTVAHPKRGWDPDTLHIGGEPATYQGDPNGASWFLDQLEAGKGNSEAVERILRSARELADVGRPMAKKPDVTRGREVLSLRAIAETAGAGGELVAPLYLQEEFLKLARAARPYVDLMRKIPLPPNTNVINIPRLKTGTSTATQKDLGAVEDVNLATGLLTFNVITVAGQEDFARQLFDRSVPELADMVVFPDLIADYITKTDVQALSGNGTLPNAKGVLEGSERNKVTFTSATPTLGELYKKIANAVQLIHTLRFLPPEAIVLHPRRWAWALTQVDSTNRPLIVPASQGPFNVFGNLNEVASEGAVGSMQGLPVFVDPSIPTNLGASTEQDAVIVQRMADSWFMEDDPIKTRVYEEVLSNELAIRAQVFNYLALTHDRYPKAVATIEGSGLNSPTF